MNVRKVLVIGTKGSGKTALIKKLAGKEDFDPNMPATTVIEKTFVSSTNVEIWDVAEHVAHAQGENPLFARDANLAVFVFDAQGDVAAQTAFLLQNKKIASRAILVVTKTDNPKNDATVFSELTTRLEVASYYPCSVKNGTGFEAIGSCIHDEIQRSANEAKTPSPAPGLNENETRVAKIFDEAKNLIQDYKEETTGKANLIASFDNLKNATLTRMADEKITVEKALHLARKTKTLAHQLISPMRNHQQRQREIEKYRDETHPITSGCRYLTRAVGAVIGAAVGFVAGLVAGVGTGPGAVATALAGGTYGAKVGAVTGLAVVGALTFWGTRNKDTERDELALQAEAFSNARHARR